MKTHHPVRSMRKQRGLVAVIVTFALFAFLGIAVLAIDINHTFMNRTKLQNSVDSAAIAAAYILDRSKSEVSARQAVEDTLDELSASEGFQELDFSAESVQLCVTFSNDLSTFPLPDPTDPTAACPDSSFSMDQKIFIRVALSGLNLNSFFMQIFGIDKTLSSSAVAGISSGGGTCNAVPMAVCATSFDSGTGTYPENGGYKNNVIYPLKLSSNTSDMGAGNFQLIDYVDDDTLSQQLAGGYAGCVSENGTVTSKTGSTMGQVGVGLNTRFGDYPNGNRGGGLEEETYPGDSNTTEAIISNELVTSINDGNEVSSTGLNINYANYLTGKVDEYSAGNGRRVLAVPIIDCSTGETGKSDYDVVSVGCFFLLQRAPENNGGGSEPNPVLGEYIEECASDNTVNNSVSSNSGAYRVVLYDDPYNKGS
ncbi:Tad domain-containing protein [Vibrio ziniensis]|uniref:Pilus assembly protein n=1 Tax=Vibrio ziniensis TaxID=2711221 RepID=A0A6G7CFT0_9VIBR|nr:Tad domain-containing protein [Vibrio ziniensis]QIH40975.1 pilus assembly protein [Vibrio ziniensis]